ncbi:Solute carrier family 22 member 7 Organic anion transporter 2 [Larimichthys crocea]|uniref:Solute carrier family 22 member 6 n=1 Tax=Larimichthys crocea TaxID=215358 RepID=A0A6G0J9S5_LARCR|nr:Solute carrier family 22 member 7 Organic anion transporter 2 [Larimichthys crocea]
MKFENILAEVNGFGKYQLRTMLLMTIARMTLPFHFLLNNFIAVIPSHHCDISSLDEKGAFRDLSQAERLIVSIPVQEDGTPSSCQMFAEPQYHLLLNSSNITDLLTVPCQNGWVYDNTTYKSTLATEWDLVCDMRRVNRATATIFFIGVMVGAAVFGYLSDRFGRKRALLVSYVITAFFGFASALSYNFAMFAAMRFFTGFGISGISIITITLAIEWLDIKHRTTGAILLSMDWCVFATVLPAVAYFVKDWRHLTATVTAPLLLAMIAWWWIPESARWLMANGKLNSAHSYLSKCAKVNGREQFMTDVTTEVLSKVILVEDDNRKYTYLDLVRTPIIRRRALLGAIVWFGVACTYYGIGLNITGFGVDIYLTQFIYGISEIPAKMFVFFTVDKIGRRFTQAGTLFLTGLCLFCNMFIPQDMGPFRTGVAALGKMFAEAAFTTVFLYTAELFPTVLRQNGLGFCSFMARIGVSVSPLIIILEEVWGHLPSTIFSVVSLAGGLSASFLPETRNIRLPETIEDVEQTRRRSISASVEKYPL